VSENKELPVWSLAIFSWLLACFFLFIFSGTVGFPPTKPMTPSTYTYLFLGLMLLFLPFFNKVKLGKFVELEREVNQTKKEVSDFKSEVRNTLSVISTNINTIGNQSNQVTVNIPGLGDLEEAKKKLDEESKGSTREEVEKIHDELILDGEDNIMALARTRIRIEYLLRKIMDKRIQSDVKGKPIRYMGLVQLFRIFSDEYSQFKNLTNPFRYVNDVCNAAIHAQKVSDAQADEAIELGARIIATLNDIEKSNGANEAMA
jgi:hypothetical protein